MPATCAQDVADFKAILGRGIEGIVDGQRCRLGNHRLVHELGLCASWLETRLSDLEQQGKTALVLVDELQPLAVFAVADTIGQPAAGRQAGDDDAPCYIGKDRHGG